MVKLLIAIVSNDVAILMIATPSQPMTMTITPPPPPSPPPPPDQYTCPVRCQCWGRGGHHLIYEHALSAVDGCQWIADDDHVAPGGRGEGLGLRVWG